MIDPKEMLAASKAAHQYGHSASASMSAPFIESVPDMNAASSQNASQMMFGVQDIGAKMLGNMTAIKDSIDRQVFVHQDKQRRQKSYDFQPDMTDLRPTDAQGFPKELADEFFAPFMVKR